MFFLPFYLSSGASGYTTGSVGSFESHVKRRKMSKDIRNAGSYGTRTNQVESLEYAAQR